MTALFVSLSARQQGSIFLGIVFAALVIGFVMWSCCAAAADRPHQPGNLARDDWPANQRTPGLGDISSVPEEPTPVFDSVVRWEQEGRP